MDEIESFANVEARTPVYQRERAPLPRSHDRVGEGRHAIEPRSPARDKSAMRFAGLLKGALERGRAESRYTDLVLIAPPRFLGILNSTLGLRLLESVVLTVARNLTPRSLSTIRTYIPRRLAMRGPLPPPVAAIARTGRARLRKPR